MSDGILLHADRMHFTVVNRVPPLSPDERERLKAELEHALFAIFRRCAP